MTKPATGFLFNVQAKSAASMDHHTCRPIPASGASAGHTTATVPLPDPPRTPNESACEPWAHSGRWLARISRFRDVFEARGDSGSGTTWGQLPTPVTCSAKVVRSRRGLRRSNRNRAKKRSRLGTRNSSFFNFRGFEPPGPIIADLFCPKRPPR